MAFVGEPMYWKFVAAVRNPLLTCHVYFANCTLFGAALKRLNAETEFAPIAPAAEVPRIMDCHLRQSPICAAIMRQTLADCDPQLVILSYPFRKEQ